MGLIPLGLIRLNLGCGKRILKDYINIDLNNNKADLIHDLVVPLPYGNGSVAEIRAEHIIEHFDRFEWPKVIRDWSRVLMSGGLISIDCPDIMRCAYNLLNDPKDRWRWLLAIYGGYKGPNENHKNGFNLDRLTADLDNVGITVTHHEYRRDRKPDPKGFNIHIKGVKR